MSSAFRPATNENRGYPNQGQVHANALSGWRTSIASKGPLFREVKLNRVSTMQRASEDA